MILFSRTSAAIAECSCWKGICDGGSGKVTAVSKFVLNLAIVANCDDELSIFMLGSGTVFHYRKIGFYFSQRWFDYA